MNRDDGQQGEKKWTEVDKVFWSMVSTSSACHSSHSHGTRIRSNSVLLGSVELVIAAEIGRAHV